jgi:hypothetical protein
MKCRDNLSIQPITVDNKDSGGANISRSSVTVPTLFIFGSVALKQIFIADLPLTLFSGRSHVSDATSVVVV